MEGDYLRLKYCIDRRREILRISVSKGRTLRCGVRYTRKKLPLPWRKGRVERDSWDTNLFKTPNLGRRVS